MMSRLYRSLGVAALSLSAALTGAEVDLHFADPDEVAHSFSLADPAGWAIEGEAVYHPPDQSLQIEGVYRTHQPIEPDAQLSYRIVDADGRVLLADGVRYAWVESPEGGLETRFILDMPQVSEDPLRTGWVVEFNAVKEGEYWYRDRFPEIEFASIRLSGLPPRDHYIPMASWVPRYLPAEMAARIPAWFRAGLRDETFSAYRPSLDLMAVDGMTKVRSARIDAEEIADGRFFGLMPLGPQELGPLLVRPGLVWESVRWYGATDWYERERVEFISPIVYLWGALVVGALLLGGWLGLRRMSQGVARWGGGLILLGATLWWWGNLMISGFWLVLVAIGLAGSLPRLKFVPPRAGAYAFAWVFMVWIEVYWGTLDGVANTQGSALLFSAATWALLLLPLLLIRARGWRWAAALATTALWWLATVVGVAYFEFFHDFPSVGDLFYAGQIGQLGDSVATLLTPRHWLPLWVWGLMVAAATVGARFSGTPKSKTQNT
jgi:hypothetical protein